MANKKKRIGVAFESKRFSLFAPSCEVRRITRNER